MFRFHQDRLKNKEKLGQGRFGSVFPYQRNPQDLKWVVKRIKADDADKLLVCLPEIVLGFGCDHPSVVTIKGYSIQKNSDNEGYNIYMKLPRMKRSLLSDLLERKKNETPYSEQEIIRYFYSLACGLSYLHSKKIYHGDLKPDNLLLDEQGTLKIGDIGIAKHVEEEDSYQTLTSPLGTYYYTAPEILGENSRDRKKDRLAKGDIWSLGVVILELCCLDHRLVNASSPQDRLQNKIAELFNSLREKYSASLILLIQKILNFDPKERPGVEEIKIKLAKDFSHILNMELPQLERAQLIRAGEESEVAILKQLLQESSKKYEIEKRHLKEIISKLEFELNQQKQHEEKKKGPFHQSESQGREERSKQEAKNLLLEEKTKALDDELQHLKVQHRRQSEIIAHSNQKISSLEQEKESYKQGNKDIEKTVEMQMKEYENQITALKESHFNEKLQFDQEKSKLLENADALQLMVVGLQKSLAELNQDRYGRDYQINLSKVALKLQGKWKQTFTFEALDKNLKIGKFHRKIKDSSVTEMSKNLILTLARHDLLNLSGLELHFTGCEKLNDKAFKDLAGAIFAKGLRVKHLILDFSYCENWTDGTFRFLAEAISIQSQNLESLSLTFRSIVKISDVGVEILATAIENSCKNLKDLILDFDNFYNENRVTSQMKDALRRRFVEIPKLHIE